VIERREIPCDLCGSDDHDVLFDARDRLYGCEGTFTYVRCRKCGLVRMNPQISPGDADKFYVSDYGPHRIVPKTGPQGNRLVKSRTQKKPFVASAIGKLAQGGRLLDVGCGNGGFLSEMTVLTGCHAHGVDTSRLAAEAAKENYGIDIFTGTVLESPFPERYFDVITAWAYLEHVNNPSEVLLKISNLLKNDGACIMSTPNFKSFNSRLFRDKWYHLDCPRHLYIYSQDTIKKLVNKAGMEITGIAFDTGARGFVNSLRYCLGDDNTALKRRKRLSGSSSLRKILLPFTALLALIGQSDMMVISAKKNR